MSILVGAHKDYDDLRALPEKYLSKAGFVDGDISELSENMLW